MSEISRLKKLLGGVEVEWKTLGDIAVIGTGSHDTKDALEQGDYIFYARGRDPLRLDKFDFDETAIITAGDGAGVGKVFHYATGKYALHQRAYRIVPGEIMDPKFVYHYITAYFYSYIQKASVSSSVMSLRRPMFLNFPIPVPSLQEQADIVRVLDGFTTLTSELTTELTAELNARKRQYNFYRDQLLGFEDGEVEWKTLEELGDFTYGYAAKAQDSGDARFVRITDISTDGKLSPTHPMFLEISDENEKYILEKNDLLMARTGATYGKTMIFGEDYPAIYAGFLIKLSLDKNLVNPKYYWHFAQSNLFWGQANKLVSGGGQPQFNANALKQVKLPIPYPTDAGKSLTEQARIISILDKFDTIASSMNDSIPCEIEMRQKQYEYYRNLLLSFPKSEAFR